MRERSSHSGSRGSALQGSVAQQNRDAPGGKRSGFQQKTVLLYLQSEAGNARHLSRSKELSRSPGTEDAQNSRTTVLTDTPAHLSQRPAWNCLFPTTFTFPPLLRVHCDTLRRHFWSQKQSTKVRGWSKSVCLGAERMPAHKEPATQMCGGWVGRETLGPMTCLIYNMGLFNPNC